ncbi:MAG: hypothetical protein IJ341_10475 [Bacteroidales bacterium]|nr:hypothetical protein [Bacteroidales bacterium]
MVAKTYSSFTKIKYFFSINVVASKLISSKRSIKRSFKIARASASLGFKTCSEVLLNSYNSPLATMVSPMVKTVSVSIGK